MLVDRIRQHCGDLERLGSEDLLQHVNELREQVRHGVPVDAERILVPACALAAEAVRRVLDKRYYDVQLIGGLVLASRAIAEMQTGEGKTITAVIPAFLHALSGRGVQVATTNVYLAERDHDELRPVYQTLGMTSGLVTADMDPEDKRRAYQADITYGPGYEFGFDFLRDQLTLRSRSDAPLGTRHLCRLRGIPLDSRQTMQRPFSFAIVDEADSVLIDEANTPLILSAPTSGERVDVTVYEAARDIAEELERDRDFEIDDATRRITFTDAGWTAVYERFDAHTLRGLRRPWSECVEQALTAKYLLKRDEHFVVRDGAVQLVDANTGRIHPERTWRGGLQQAVEFRAGVEPTPENETNARISRQKYFQFYPGLCGLTGTASGGETEFREFYRLPVVVVPTHKPCQRTALPAKSFVDGDSRDQAVCGDALDHSRRDQPVLIGTRTIRHSRMLADRLQQAGVEHQVLNGVQDADEADIVAAAGRAGTVTIATNMAGRGTDIRLDERSRTAGGLHVIVAEHNLSRRVDRQLIGRAARQGEPGSFRFYLSANDEIATGSGAALAEAIRRDADEFGEHHGDLSPQVRLVQQHQEHRALTARRQLMLRDCWLDSILETLARQA